MVQSSPTVTGHLDGLRGTTIVGWAFGNHTPCRIRAVDDSGAEVASGYACLERPDLLCLGQGRCDFAFSLPTSASSNSNRIHVFADGVEIVNSPLPVGTGHFDGMFEASAGEIKGWVAERSAGGSAPLVTIVDQDGEVIFKAQSVRQTEPQSEEIEALAHFTGRIALRCFGAGERCLTSFANGVKFAEASCNLGLQGNVERLSADHCAGWLLSTDAPACPLEFEIFRNNEYVTTVKCDIARSDVQARFPGVVKSGFSCALSVSSADPSKPTCISLRFPNSSRELFDGPFLMANRPAVVEAARSASRLIMSLVGDAQERTLRLALRSAITDFLKKARESETTVFRQSFSVGPKRRGPERRLSVVIPIYRGLDITRACIESVLKVRSPDNDRVILVHDQSPDVGMSGMLQTFLTQPNLLLVHNPRNLGFIKSVNRAISITHDEDIVLLNSDTLVFSGAFEVLWQVAHSDAGIGTVTAMSNNATIFSYPHYNLRKEQLNDVSWEELAAAALTLNGNLSIDVPSGHGFCMLVKRDVLDYLLGLDESFGRGYGEENDLCSRAADLGFRNVAAGGVIVQHRESISFLEEKGTLLARNLALIESRYPEYTPTVIEFERKDNLRAARWALDEHRLRLASERGKTFVVVISHKLGGGTRKAMNDIETLVGYGVSEKIAVSCRLDGYVELECNSPLLCATFSPEEMQELFKVLSAANAILVLMHQVLGFSKDFIERLIMKLPEQRSVFYAHDFYTFCPRVTMIDATDQFCNQASIDVCNRCVDLGGPHPSSRLRSMTPEQHRKLLEQLLSNFTYIVAPSSDAARYLKTAFPAVPFVVLPHPEPNIEAQPRLRPQGNEIVLFGALGRHKGSSKLRDIAQLAQLIAPELRFTVVGYTDIDHELSKLGNVSITGAYSDESLPEIVGRIGGQLALFLSTWPETYSYTLSEALALGFYPLVPDIGAPAERVRTSRYGSIFPFPIIASEVIQLIRQVQIDFTKNNKRRLSLPNDATSGNLIQRTRDLFLLLDKRDSTFRAQASDRSC